MFASRVALPILSQSDQEELCPLSPVGRSSRPRRSRREAHCVVAELRAILPFRFPHQDVMSAKVQSTARLEPIVARHQLDNAREALALIWRGVAMTSIASGCCGNHALSLPGGCIWWIRYRTWMTSWWIRCCDTPSWRPASLPVFAGAKSPSRCSRTTVRRRLCPVLTETYRISASSGDSAASRARRWRRVGKAPSRWR